MWRNFRSVFVKYLIIRNDDIDYFANVIFINQLIKDIYPFKQTFGVIPFTRINGIEYSITENNLLKKLLVDSDYIALHGILHNYSPKKYEFADLTHIDFLKEKLDHIFKEKAIKTNIFIPPHNYILEEYRMMLVEYGFNIFSETKRKICIQEDSQISCLDEEDFLCGVIKENFYYRVPQSIMIKREDFYKTENYFYKLKNLITNYYKCCNIFVLTLHWWDFFNKGAVDYQYYDEFIKFIQDLNCLNIKSCSFNQIINLSDAIYISKNIFDIK